MYFVVTCKDKPGKLDLRMETRPIHVEYLTGLFDRGALKVAGPMLDGDGKPNGSLLIYEADDLATVEGYASGDPYARAGVFDTVDIRPWNWTFGKPE